MATKLSAEENNLTVHSACNLTNLLDVYISHCIEVGETDYIQDKVGLAADLAAFQVLPLDSVARTSQVHTNDGVQGLVQATSQLRHSSRSVRPKVRDDDARYELSSYRRSSLDTVRTVEKPAVGPLTRNTRALPARVRTCLPSPGPTSPLPQTPSGLGDSERPASLVLAIPDEVPIAASPTAVDSLLAAPHSEPIMPTLIKNRIRALRNNLVPGADKVIYASIADGNDVESEDEEDDEGQAQEVVQPEEHDGGAASEADNMSVPPQSEYVGSEAEENSSDEEDALHTGFTWGNKQARWYPEASAKFLDWRYRDDATEPAEDTVSSEDIVPSQDIVPSEDTVPSEDIVASNKKLTTGKRKRRGKQSQAKHRANRNATSRAAARPGDGLHNTNREKRLFLRGVKNGQAVRLTSYDIIQDGSVSTTGWQGKPPPKWARKRIRQEYATTNPDKAQAFRKVLGTFLPLPYYAKKNSMEKIALWLVDRQDRLFAYRGFPALWLEDSKAELCNLIDELLGRDLKNAGVKKSCKSGARGPHFPCIIGHYRQSKAVPCLTEWHRQHITEVEKFLSNPLIKKLNAHVASVMAIIFPGIVNRFKRSAEWHKTHHGIEPLFGPFWNWCINGIFPDQKRIHTIPHADAKNPIGVCALMAYLYPDSHFNHSKRSWLVLWEAGVIIEIPPWVLVIYPSSMFYHFNIDVNKIEWVITDQDVNWPTPENSQPITDDDDKGRGSMVWFSEATMYQSSETGYGSVRAAQAAGYAGTASFPETAQEAFQRCGNFVYLPGQP